MTAVLAALLGLLYYVIFGFSAQDAEESGSLSRNVSERCVEIFNSFSGGRWGHDEMDQMVEAIEHPLRKLAHFTEYAYMGILVYGLLCQWMGRGKRRCLLTAGWIFLSAAGDEFHQYFVPGRYASFLDVLLDTGGGVCGMLFCVLAAMVCRKWADKRKHKQTGKGKRRQEEVSMNSGDLMTRRKVKNIGRK